MLLQSLFSASVGSDSEWQLLWLLRVCVAMTFAGHGYLATQTQAGWYVYMATAGVGRRDVAKPLMQLIGVLDLALAAAVMFVHPLPLVHVWCCVWGVATALMRPLSGESWAQFVERSGNFLPPLCLLWLDAHAGRIPHGFSHYVLLTAFILGAGTVACILLRISGLLSEKPTAETKRQQQSKKIH